MMIIENRNVIPKGTGRNYVIYHVGDSGAEH